MAVNSGSNTELLNPQQKWIDREINPERTKVWTEHKPRAEKKVAVIYYLSRNGQLQHPHFMEVPLSSSHGLYLRDVMNRLNFLRGKGMASMYSWSSRRIYKNGFVWHDLSENDLIQPTNGREYVLKGSELLQSSISLRYTESTRSPDEEAPADDYGLPASIGRRNLSWSPFDDARCDYRVNKADSNRKSSGKAADAATQTGVKMRPRGHGGEETEEKALREQSGESTTAITSTTTELRREEISPPFSSSSLDDSEVAGEKRSVDRSADIRDRTAVNEHPSGRIKASHAFKQLVTCGSVSIMDSTLLRS